MVLTTTMRVIIGSVAAIVVIAAGVAFYASETPRKITPRPSPIGSSDVPSSVLPTTPSPNGSASNPVPATIYVSIVSHNEDTSGASSYDFAVNEGAFVAQRDQTAKFAAMLAGHHVKYDFQTDWNFLLGMNAFDHGSALTNDKNLLRYLVEDLGMVVDPHSHEHSGYNYADVAYLISTFGVAPSSIVGGFIVSPVSESILDRFQQPMRGEKYPQYVWTPTATWGGGTHGHVDDTAVNTSGIWRPQSSANFLVADPNGLLPNIGRYNGDWSGLDDLLAKQKDGALLAGQMYTATVFTNQNILTDDYIAQFSAMLDGYAADTAAGRLVWSALPEVLSVWETAYHEVPTVLGLSEELPVSSLSPANGFLSKVTGFPLSGTSGTSGDGIPATTSFDGTESSTCGNGVCVAPENTYNCAADCRAKK